MEKGNETQKNIKYSNGNAFDAAGRHMRYGRGCICFRYRKHCHCCICTYEIYKYNKGNKKYQLAYKVKGKKLYQYNSKKKKYYIKAFVSKRGYVSRYSAKSKAVKVK